MPLGIIGHLAAVEGRLRSMACPAVAWKSSAERQELRHEGFR